MIQKITALGEVFNYLFDSKNNELALRKVFQNVFQALDPGGLLIFDIAEPGRHKGQRQGFRVADDWACMVDFEYDDVRRRLIRHITSFRKVGELYRRSEETHELNLYDSGELVTSLEEIGFQTHKVRNYGDNVFPESLVGIVARKG